MEGDRQTLGFCRSGAHDSFVNRWQMKVPKSKVRLVVDGYKRRSEWEKGVSYCELEYMIIVRPLTYFLNT